MGYGRPLEAVFDYLSDFTHTNEWDPGTVSTIRTFGDGGLGTTYDNTSEFMGRKVGERIHVCETDANALVAQQLASPSPTHGRRPPPHGASPRRLL